MRHQMVLIVTLILSLAATVQAAPTEELVRNIPEPMSLAVIGVAVLTLFRGRPKRRIRIAK